MHQVFTQMLKTSRLFCFPVKRVSRNIGVQEDVKYFTIYTVVVYDSHVVISTLAFSKNSTLLSIWALKQVWKKRKYSKEVLCFSVQQIIETMIPMRWKFSQKFHAKRWKRQQSERNMSPGKRLHTLLADHLRDDETKDQTMIGQW